MTVRGVFYRLVGEYLVNKTEREYDNVGRYLVKLRQTDKVPYEWLSDSTRWMRKPRSHDGMAAALRETANTYRRALWRDQNAYVEIWIEKDTLAGVVMDETEPYDVPLMVARGFSSLTYLYEAAQTIKEQSKPVFIYLLTDHDPSGHTTARKIEARLREFAPEATFTFERLAVTEPQIIQWNLPTRPTKASTHDRGFVGESVELDAIPAPLLRLLVRDAIEQHVDQAVLARTKAIERREQATLTAMSRSLAKHEKEYLKDLPGYTADDETDGDA
jgi:hypothetical protein